MSKASEPKVRTSKIAELTPDPHNANKGTERGRSLLRESIERLGLGRSIVTDTHGTIIGGNQAHGVAGAVGLTETIIVRTTGDRLVVVQRDDLDLSAEPGTPEHDKARTLALADNRAGELNLDWNVEVLADYSSTVDLDDWFYPDELSEVFDAAGSGNWSDGSADNEASDGVNSPLSESEGSRQQPAGMKTPLAIALTSSELKRWNTFKEQCGTKGDTSAFLRLLEAQEN